MTESANVPRSRDKLLFTPGPLTTSASVKQAMLRDLGSRDHEFIAAVEDVRESLLRLAGVSREAGFEAVPIQGSGTFGVESVVGSSVPRDGKLLVVINGAYGERIATMAKVLGIETSEIRFAEDARIDLEELRAALSADDSITGVAVVHCETTTGMIHPLDDIGAIVNGAGKSFIVDAMSSFGAVPVDLERAHIDFLVSSANKCIEGVPGFSFAICRRSALEECEGRARSLSLDLYAQWRGLEMNGQFRFTPPTHVILAFREALREIEAEGGIEGRMARYQRNHATLVKGMRRLGFREYLTPEDQGWIITSFRYPDDPRFDFEAFYTKLAERDLVIYPGKVSNADCFRIGNIGRVFESDVRQLLAAVEAVIGELGGEL